MSLVCLLSFLCVFVCAQLVQVMVGGATSARALAADLMQQSIRLQQASMRLRGMLLRGEVDRERVIVREIMAEVSDVLEQQASACIAWARRQEQALAESSSEELPPRKRPRGI